VKDSPVLDVVSATSHRQVCSGTCNQAGERGSG
jgi:hypothetical protein